MDGDRGRQPDPGAAGLWPTAILQACLAAPLTYLPVPCGRRWADLCGGRGLTPPPQWARAPGQGHPPLPPELGLPPPPIVKVRGRRAPPGPHARRAGKRHLPAPALAHGR